MSVRMLHTADWQIGKQFANVPGDAGAALRTQRLATIAGLADLATASLVDVVLVAGDVFDDNAVSDDTLRRTINAMSGYSGPWVLLPGNHDAGLTQSVWSRLRKLAILTENVFLADEPEAIDLLDGKLQILPAPLKRRQEARDLTAWFDRHLSPGGVFRVGIAHGSVTNRLPEAAETHNPISDTRTQTANLDYLALGDWHGTLHIADKTWYAGTPEQDRFRQNAPGNALLVDIKAPGSEPDVEVVSVGRYFWHQLEFTVTDDDSLSILDNRLRELGEDAQRILLRLRLAGAVTLATRQALSALLETWSARYHFLQVDDSALAAQPSSEDISEMAATGFLKEAINAIVAVEENPADPDQPYASRALQILYSTQQELAR